MQFNYYSSRIDKSYIGRVFLLAKRNYWLFLPDVIILMVLVFPPYSIKELLVLSGFILLLLVRDIILLKFSKFSLNKFVVKGNDVCISILKRNEQYKEIKEWLPDIELEIKYTYHIPALYISKRNELLFKQYPVGIWSVSYMKEFVESFYDYKKEQALWKIFKGQ